MEPLQHQLLADPLNHELRYKLAEAQMGVGLHADALDNLFALLAVSPSWGEGRAKALILKLLESLGNDPVVTSGRKRLSKLLFR